MKKDGTKSKKSWRAVLTIGLWILAIIFLLWLSVMFFARRAVDSYRTSVTEQLSAAVKGENSDAPPIKISNVPMADIVSGRYKSVKNLGETYEKLLTGTRNYVLALSAQNDATDAYNVWAGTKSVENATKLLEATRRYKSEIGRIYSGDSARLAEIREALSAAGDDASKLNTVAVGTTLRDNAAWLNEKRDELNRLTSEFQENLNSN